MKDGGRWEEVRQGGQIAWWLCPFQDFRFEFLNLKESKMVQDEKQPNRLVIASLPSFQAASKPCLLLIVTDFTAAAS